MARSLAGVAGIEVIGDPAKEGTMLAPRVLLAAVLIGIPVAADAQDITALIEAG
jgi:hypothetical protein